MTSKRVRNVLLIGAAVLLIGCAYAVFYIKTGIGVPCPFYLLTGMKCPGCGVTRMVVSLLHFDLVSAFRYNAVLLCLLPFILYLLFSHAVRYLRGGTKPIFDRIVGIACIAILAAWGVVRNIIHK